jgi:hypothetical protein
VSVHRTGFRFCFLLSSAPVFIIIYIIFNIKFITVIIWQDIPSEMGNGFAQQLYLLQYHILDQIQDRMMTRIEPQDSLGKQFYSYYVLVVVSHSGSDTG